MATVADTAARASALSTTGGTFSVNGIAIVAAVFFGPALGLTITVVTFVAVIVRGTGGFNSVATGGFKVAAAIAVGQTSTITVAVAGVFTTDTVARIRTNASGLTCFGAGTIDGILVVTAVINGLALLVGVTVLIAGAVAMGGTTTVRVGFTKFVGVVAATVGKFGAHGIAEAVVVGTETTANTVTGAFASTAGGFFSATPRGEVAAAVTIIRAGIVTVAIPSVANAIAGICTRASTGTASDTVSSVVTAAITHIFTSIIAHAVTAGGSASTCIIAGAGAEALSSAH